MPQFAFVFHRFRRRPLLGALWAAWLVAGCGPSAASPDVSRGAEPAHREPAEHRPQLARIEPSAPLQISPSFRDVALVSGIEFQYFNDARPGRFFFPEVMGGGVGWLDYDNDGRLDLLATNGCRWPDVERTPEDTVCRLFRNREGGRFADVSLVSRAASRAFGMGCAVADFNADGFADIYLTNYGENLLLCNLGDGTFFDASQRSGTGDEGWSTGAAWFDADQDGDEDLYVVNYIDVTIENSAPCRYIHDLPGYCGPGRFEAQADRLFLNAGDGRFDESAAAFGLVGVEGKGMGIAVLDLDDDLLPELYVANDMEANYLFTSTPRDPSAGTSPRYRDVAVQAGCALSGAGEVEASMGIGCADFDGDGRIDLFLTHYFAQKNTLYHNLGALHFHDDSFGSRVAAISKMFLGFGAVPIDFDRDGAADLFIANGHVLGANLAPNEMQPQLLHNDGRGRFDDVSALAGPYFEQAQLGRGVALCDFDNDGDADVAVSSLDQPLALLRNDTLVPGRHFMGLQLRCPNRTAPVGGRVVVTAAGKSSVQPVVSGGSYLAASDTRMLFALGEAEAADEVRIFWPSGRVDRFTDLAGDRYWTVLEGQRPCLLP